MRLKFIALVILFCGNILLAQHSFKGQIDTDIWQNQVYLSLIDDYRTLGGIVEEQIISMIDTDLEGYFEFSGNLLEDQNVIYKLHVDNCNTVERANNHFDGHCKDSRDILFIAKGNDTITFPLGFEDQVFCDIYSTNPKTSALIKIDSLKEEMRFDYGEFRSKANRELNNKKWFKKLQNFGASLNEPLAELYIYSFLSNRGHSLHSYYLEDLRTNPYYNELLNRLKTTYPKSKYTVQYEAELKADKYIISGKNQINETETSQIPWLLMLILTIVISVGTNLYFFHSRKRRKKSNIVAQFKDNLTAQEQNVLDLLLENHSNKEIASTLFVSVSTVKSHINSIYKKLGINSRDDAKSLFSK